MMRATVRRIPVWDIDVAGQCRGHRDHAGADLVGAGTGAARRPPGRDIDRPWRRDLTVAVLRAQGPPSAVGPRTWWQNAAATVRTSSWSPRGAPCRRMRPGYCRVLIDGDISRLPDHVREDFRAVDLTHLLAVSGTNVSIMLAGVLLATRALTLDPRLGALLAGLALVGFVILARPSPSVLRASVMGAIAVLASMTGRRKQALPALCAAVIVLVGIWPHLAVDAGFALSVLATAALILLAPGWTRWLERRGWPAPGSPRRSVWRRPRSWSPHRSSSPSPDM